ncbi:MAG: RNA-processing protein [Archaeoglobaceae archaeon]
MSQEQEQGQKWKLWFGEVGSEGEESGEGEDIRVSDDLSLSFINAGNAQKPPYSLPKLGSKVFGSAEEYYKLLRKTAINVGKERAEKQLKREDRYIIMLLKSLDQLDESINLLTEKWRDVVEIKSSDATDELKERIEELYDLRKDLEQEIEQNLEKIAPNLSELLGSVITARLLEKANSLERLAMLPSSVIQVLGAERSLFRAKSRMKKGKSARMPKHGVIFQHKFIRNLPKEKRGKMSRFMAAKIAIAAKLDYFKGEFHPEIVESAENRFRELLS